MFTKEEWDIQKNRILNLQKRETVDQLLQPEFINHLQSRYLESKLNEIVNSAEIQRLSALLQLSSANLIDAPSGKFYNKEGLEPIE